MKPVLLEPEVFTIKVISIDSKSISPETIEQLKDYATYEDTLIGEDLYGCTVREDILQREVLKANVEFQLREIQTLCTEHDASYFRIVEL